jgi:hypothetical protein
MVKPEIPTIRSDVKNGFRPKRLEPVLHFGDRHEKSIEGILHDKGFEGRYDRAEKDQVR